jgi:hypothetical protein
MAGRSWRKANGRLAANITSAPIQTNETPGMTWTLKPTEVGFSLVPFRNASEVARTTLLV